MYEDIVVQGKEHPEKLNSMGAWKTGCLKKDAPKMVYTDRNGQCYSYTDRWDDHTPVDESTWNYINDHQAVVQS